MSESGSNTQSPQVLRLHGISKAFGGVQALDDVSITVRAGQVHAVVGENGAGKSTLMKITAGALQPDSGSIHLLDQVVSFRTPKEAADSGIAIVYQEPTYFPDLSVLENFYVGDEMVGRLGLVHWRRMVEEAASALDEMQLSADLLTRSMSELSIGTQQLVLIAKGIHRNAQILILDEPTSILSQAETDTLFHTINRLRERNISVLYISHRMPEIFDVSDEITVLRDGQRVAGMATSSATEAGIVEAMTGRMLDTSIYEARPIDASRPLLEVRGLSSTGYFTDVSLSVSAGQIVGVYGLVGAGRTEFATAIVGELARDAGDVFLDGKQFKPSGLSGSLDAGVVYLPEDRNTQGLFLPRAIRDNLSAGLLRRLSNALGIVDRNAERDRTVQQAQTLRIKTPTIEAPAKSLSGGNQQKVLLGRGLLQQPRVLILDEPTRGIDVGTKQEIHKLIVELARSGLAILMISSDLPEVFAIADTFVVMHEGRIGGTLSREEATEERVIKLALSMEE